MPTDVVIVHRLHCRTRQLKGECAGGCTTLWAAVTACCSALSVEATAGAAALAVEAAAADAAEVTGAGTAGGADTSGPNSAPSASVSGRAAVAVVRSAAHLASCSSAAYAFYGKSRIVTTQSRTRDHAHQSMVVSQQHCVLIVCD